MTVDHPTRRAVLALLAALGLSAGMAMSGRRVDLRALFEARLADTRMPYAARLSLTRFEDDGTRITAVVRMDWAPGVRIRTVATALRDPLMALDALHADVVRTFSSAGRLR